MSKKIQFRGQISPIMSAIRIGADTMRVQIDIPKSDHLSAVPLQAMLDVPLRFTVELDDTPATRSAEEQPEPAVITYTDDGYHYKAEKKPKGPHSDYWQGMFKKGFSNYPDLIQVLDCAGDQIRLRLHDVFEINSLTQISPQQFEDWLASEGLHSLITLSRQVRAKLQEAA